MTSSTTEASAPTPAETDPTTVPELVAAATRAGVVWAATSRQDRAAVLDAVADALDAAGGTLVPLAVEDSHLAEGRLRGELQRTTFQLRLFGEVLREGSYLDVRVDHPDAEWPMGAPRPDLRRTMVPLGPVVVFAAGNFPFAFSVAGNDMASALAAGCPVLLKAHPGHLRLSLATAEVVQRALAEAGAPEGLFTLVVGDEAGRAALTDPGVTAGGFTGSTGGGRALFDLAVSRPVPIPFFGELGSVNPVFVTRAAAEARGAEIAKEAIGSFTLGAGQFCTKPGVLVVPNGSPLLEALSSADLPGPAPMLSERMVEGHNRVRHELEGVAGVEVLARGTDAEDGTPAPTILRTDVATLLADVEDLFRECFGPTVLVATYEGSGGNEDLVALAQAIDGQLTASVFGETSDVEGVRELVSVLANRAGRLLWNAWPTGVSVTYAQEHGGPYPATTAPSTTSVGTGAIARWLRPVAYQGFPSGLLPGELRDELDEGADAPRLEDGRLRLSGRER
ncbi:aldehyde dehydrogenase family protein [Microlunatus flavus]|uniref:NADP-dependent aldehyde dehydrogenase n=1 Tax=Microlunatus flavus TaxID=1036181 RepID=A0A1H9HJH9_9ACTN|nr:aldehyde dehydrogenase family protein [Microlunatus flavus]SEQ62509.1 NADP-dependent aldehyde dehydrogenase [Microlunatus flavus]